MLTIMKHEPTARGRSPRARFAFTPVEILIALVIFGIMAITIGISLTVIT